LCEQAMTLLARYCLVESHLQTGSYGLHVCVHDWTLNALNRDIDTSQYWLAFDCIAGHVRLEDWDNLSGLRYRRLTPHAVRLVHERFQRAGCQQEWLQSELSTAEDIGQLLYKQIQYKAAELMYLRVLSGKEKALGPDHTSTLDTVHNLGNLYRGQGKLGEAERMYVRALAGKELEQQIHETTQIPITALRGTPLSDFRVDERMQWAANRNTKRKEDKAYCLMGIFNVFIPLIYGEGGNAFRRLEEEIYKFSSRQSTEKTDAWIREKCYSPANLKIERLSGKELSMDQCYINLAIVQQHSQDLRSSKDGDTSSRDGDSARESSPFSLFTRLQVKERNEGTQVPLSTIFDPRKGRDGHEKQPRRILIRGQAGVGKTTLCKKIVYDFTYAGVWADSFSRLLWIPLRKLKGKAAGYNIQDLFRDVFFFNDVDRTHGETERCRLFRLEARSLVSFAFRRRVNPTRRRTPRILSASPLSPPVRTLDSEWLSRSTARSRSLWLKQREVRALYAKTGASQGGDTRLSAKRTSSSGCSDT
jgi:hypothetical protein